MEKEILSIIREPSYDPSGTPLPDDEMIINTKPVPFTLYKYKQEDRTDTEIYLIKGQLTVKYDARTGFTIVEMLIGVVMMSIVIAGIAFTVRFGFNLFTTADSNAAGSAVCVTADSFKRTVAPCSM